jgi:hypothetical protein
MAMPSGLLVLRDAVRSRVDQSAGWGRLTAAFGIVVVRNAADIARRISSGSLDQRVHLTAVSQVWRCSRPTR